jgi:hypothetical protein
VAMCENGVKTGLNLTLGVMGRIIQNPTASCAADRGAMTHFTAG